MPIIIGIIIIPWNIKDRMFAHLQKKIIRTYLKKTDLPLVFLPKDAGQMLSRAIWVKEGKTTQHTVS